MAKDAVTGASWSSQTLLVINAALFANAIAQHSSQRAMVARCRQLDFISPRCDQMDGVRGGR